MSTVDPHSTLADEELRASVNRIIAETAKLNAEAFKMQREGMLYPLVVAFGALGSGSALTFIIIGVAKALGWLDT